MDILKQRYRKLLSNVKTDIRRSLYYQIDWSQPLIGIKGQRGVGKSTLMLQRIKDVDPSGESSFYTSLDNLWFAEHSLIDLAELLIKQGVGYLYLDDVHRLPGWEQQIKNLYDSYPELHVVFTSSSLLVIDHSIGDLSRQVSMYWLPGLSFREFLVFEEINEGLAKPQKILLNNSTLMCALDSPKIGAERECTFASFLSVGHRVGYAKNGDFVVDNRYLFEIGGKKKEFSQIRDIPDSFVVADDIEIGVGNRIPLWLFGFLY